LEQLKQQRALAAQQLKEESVQRTYHEHLDKIAAGDEEAIAGLGGVDAWMKFAAPGMTLSLDSYPRVSNSALVMNSSFQLEVGRQLDYRGFVTIDGGLFDWAGHNVDFSAMAKTMSNLVDKGWPPVFIFVFDQPWLMMLRLFDLMQPILNDEEATLEASMAAWSLTKPELNQASQKERVGGNFGVPHRDITYKNCHNSVDGSPDILSLWIPLEEVSLDNGCMFCVPRECDPQFDKDAVASDQDPFSHKFQYASITPLAPMRGGDVNVWHPNLIHWGGACSASSSLPARQSIAMAFRVRDETRASTPKEVERYGRMPFTRRELQEGGPNYKARLRMIVKSLQLYNVWYPLYSGLNLDLFNNEEK